ncbi:DUF4245 domain-containing protein [Couchioplanes azureus]|uniref:DUF4245 domain-containing protein n=1 Tax=Couchioplanes caeruleus TaxID=56438 RepID=UPI0019B73C78|nr:DUF4245 domain-containing protein [Couchioplanes caeruleus]GGQ41080.1 hypothetical protein GCM10010166_05500 [Couchioplanes caeruleus subsp. azureus]
MSSPETPTVGKRAERRPRDMVMSLAVLLVPIALLLLFYRLVLDGDKPISVDAAPTLQQARAANVFPVSEPQGLGADWHVQTATFKREPGGATLRLGYADPGGDSLQVVESSVATATLIPAELGKEPKAVGTYRAGARTWQRYDARPGENALVLLEKGRTIIVVGKADSAYLEKLAAALP